MNIILLIILALAAGCGLSLQAGINSQLARQSGHGMWSALASFVIGAVFLIPFTLLPHPGWPTQAAISEVRWWAWTGGMIGAAYVISTIMLSPRLGATAFFGIVIAGQMVMSLWLDHHGLLGYPVHRVNPMRLLGTALVIVGVVMVRRF
jgi:transporter family-2 protein